MFKLPTFLERLKEERTTISFEGNTIQVPVLSSIINDENINSKISSINFRDCTFKPSQSFGVFFQDIERPNLNISFEGCSFLGGITFIDCTLDNLTVYETKEMTCDFGFSVRESTVKVFQFRNTTENHENNLEGNIYISGCTFEKEVFIDNIVHSKGHFVFTNNNLLGTAKGGGNINAFFRNSIFNNVDFSRTNFGEDVSFYKVKLTHDTYGDCFQDTIFGKAYFSETNFGKHVRFIRSIFNGDTHFLACENLENTKLKLWECTFKKQAVFDGTKFKEFIIEDVIFENRASFLYTEFNTIDLKSAIFQKATFFDGIKINDIASCTRHTLSKIKNELLKAENRIDANRFKAYELEVYKRDVKNWKDHFILWLNNISSKHGLDWVQGIKFTLIAGMLFYIPYFISENYAKELLLNLETFDHFLSGYFNYLIPWYKPAFENALTNSLQVFLFLFGKIVIGYGIYQTVSSFRKFRF